MASLQSIKKRKAKHLKRPQTQENFFLPFRCLGLADWQPNSVLGPLLCLLLTLLISHITEFCSILRGGGAISLNMKVPCSVVVQLSFIEASETRIFSIKGGDHKSKTEISTLGNSNASQAQM